MTQRPAEIRLERWVPLIWDCQLLVDPRAPEEWLGLRHFTSWPNLREPFATWTARIVSFCPRRSFTPAARSG
jgi:hypothetical protein